MKEQLSRTGLPVNVEPCRLAETAKNVGFLDGSPLQLRIPT